MAPKEKKSKKEKQQEKEAELARLAEEQRIQEEKEEKERQEEEARRKKEQGERAAEELQLQGELEQRLEGESAANAEWYASRTIRLATEQAAALSGSEWDRFVACGERPDVMSEGDMNTFLTEWRERPRADLWKTLPTCTLATEMLSSTQLEAAHAHDRGDDKLAIWQRELQILIFDELLSKLDSATAEFLQRSEDFVNNKMECCVTVAARGCHFGLWVNLAKNPRIKSIEYADLSIAVELPKSLALASIAVRVTQYDNDFISPYASAESVASATSMALGGILKIDLLLLPPPAKKIKGWTMRPVTEMTTSVSHQPYPIPGADGVIPMSAPPLRISYVLDPGVMVPEGETQQVGWWDDKEEMWKTDDISDIQWAPETRTISFDTLHLTALALLQPTHLEFPFKNWLLSPSTSSSADLYVQTQNHLLHVAVSAKGVVLKAPRLPALSALLDTPLAASTLFLGLRRAGINLMPRDVDATKLERVTPKAAALEKEMHQAIAPLAARYHLCASRWNLSRGASKGTLRFAMKAESYADESAESSSTPDDPFAAIEPDWATLEFSQKRVLLIAATDEDDSCNELAAEGVVAHSTPLECFKERDPDLQEELLSSSRLYQDSVRQLLDNLRLLSFTKLD